MKEEYTFMEKTKSKSKVLILGAGIILGIVLIVISVVAFNKGNQNEKKCCDNKFTSENH